MDTFTTKEMLETDCRVEIVNVFKYIDSTEPIQNIFADLINTDVKLRVLKNSIGDDVDFNDYPEDVIEITKEIQTYIDTVTIVDNYIITCITHDTVNPEYAGVIKLNENDKFIITVHEGDHLPTIIINPPIDMQIRTNLTTFSDDIAGTFEAIDNIFAEFELQDGLYVSYCDMAEGANSISSPAEYLLYKQAILDKRYEEVEEFQYTPYTLVLCN